MRQHARQTVRTDKPTTGAGIDSSPLFLIISAPCRNPWLAAVEGASKLLLKSNCHHCEYRAKSAEGKVRYPFSTRGFATIDSNRRCVNLCHLPDPALVGQTKSGKVESHAAGVKAAQRQVTGAENGALAPPGMKETHEANR